MTVKCTNYYSFMTLKRQPTGENKNNINHTVNYLSDRKIAEKFSFMTLKIVVEDDGLS